MRFALLVDTSLTSYLMMGSLSQGLKEYAVTLFEAGKLGNCSIKCLCQELHKLSLIKLEGEFEQFSQYAFSLLYVLKYLCSGGTCIIEQKPSKVTNMQTVWNKQLESKEINGTHGQNRKDGIHDNQSTIEDYEPEEGFRTSDPLINGEKPLFSVFQGMPSREVYCTTDLSGMEHFLATSNERNFTNPEHNELQIRDTIDYENIQSFNSSICYPVDVLRCENLAGRASATLQHVIKRDYDVVVCMNPLPFFPAVISQDESSVSVFGPPSRSSMTPWMKLLLYCMAESGPISVVLMKGQRLLALPFPLVGCAKALVWTWNDVSVYGFNKNFDGTLVEGGILLHCLNCITRYTAVLVQPFSEACLDDNSRPVTLDLPLPCCEENNPISFPLDNKNSVENLHQYFKIISAKSDLNLSTVGYLRFLRVPSSRNYLRMSKSVACDNGQWEWIPLSMEFGVPLFDKDLCTLVCNALVHAQLFNPDSLLKYNEAMKNLRRRLQNFISDYKIDGQISRTYFEKNGSIQNLLSIQSTRWSMNGDNILDGLTPSSLESPLTSRYSSHIEASRKWPEISRHFSTLSGLFDDKIPDTESAALLSSTHIPKVEFLDDDESSEDPLPGINLLFNGTWLSALDVSPCLQGRLPASLIAEGEKMEASYI